LNGVDVARFEPDGALGIPRKVQKLTGSPEHEGLFLPSHVAPGLSEMSDAAPRPRQTWADVP